MHMCDSLFCYYDGVSPCLCQNDSAGQCNLAFLISSFHILTSILNIKAMQIQQSAREQYTNAILQTHAHANNQMLRPYSNTGQ